MMSSNTRSTRSRYSSPAQPQAQNGSWNGRPLEVSKSSANEASRSFMKNWLEPSIQSKTSFEEAGLMRYGVVEQMAPLGSMPKAKKPGADNGSAVRRIILRPSGAGGKGTPTSKPAQEEPAPKSAKATAASPPPSPDKEGRRSSITARGLDDDEYEPKEAPRRRQSGRVLPTKNAQPSTARRRSSVHVVKPETPKQPKAARRSVVVDKDMADKVVEVAVDEALKHYRYPTAWALRTLYDEKSNEPDFVSMIEEVFGQTADAATLAEFSRLMEEKKREGKKDNRGCYYFVPPATNSRFTPHKPKAAPYARLLALREQSLGEPSGRKGHQGSEARAAKRAKTSSETPRKMGRPSTKVNGSSTRTPGSRKRPRRDSGSSISSLSSAMSLTSPEESPEEKTQLVHNDSLEMSPSFRGRGRGRGRDRPATTRRGTIGGGGGAATDTPTGPQPSDAPKSQPITTRGKSLASNKQAMSNASESNSPTRHPRRPFPTASTADARTSSSMPGRLAASELFPNLPSKSATKAARENRENRENKEGSAGVKASPMSEEAVDAVAEDDGFWDRRRDAQKITNGFRALDSSVRGGLDERDGDATPARRTRKTRQSLAAPLSTRATRSASRRPNDDVEGTVSPVTLSFFGEPGSVVASRASTPSTSLRPAKKQKTGLRVKSSPVKKKGGTAAGVPRSMGEANMALNNGAPKDPTSDNDECCSACGNTGDVVCCDGCPRSFHFECVDMVQSENLPDEWYCNECLIKKYPSRVPVHTGAFGSALNTLEKSIPRAFSLPKRVQNRFEGVKAGADGDYEDVASNKAARKRAGYEDVPDFFKQREDGQAVLCHACQKPATEIRSIILCSACPLHWHLDCLDPPMAVPPALKTWRCPAHIDDVLLEEPPLAPAHRFRKIKGGLPISPAFTRGLKNNGHIDIDWEDEPEEPPGSGWPDPHTFGRTYKLPAKGIVLDFIEQLRNQGAGYGYRQDEPRRVPSVLPLTSYPSDPLLGSTMQRTMEEMQVSLNLIGLRQKRTEGIDHLTSALLAGADQDVLTLMAKGSASNIASGTLTDSDRTSLRAMLAQMDVMSSRIRQALDGGSQTHPPSASSPPITEPADDNEASAMRKSMAPVTEPTPPSTVDQGEGRMDLD